MLTEQHRNSYQNKSICNLNIRCVVFGVTGISMESTYVLCLQTSYSFIKHCNANNSDVISYLLYRHCLKVIKKSGEISCLAAFVQEIVKIMNKY